MNWLFGKKKSLPEVFVADDTPEGFSPVVTARPYESPLPPYPTLPRPDSAAYPYTAPYPHSPYSASPYPVNPSPYPANPSPYPGSQAPYPAHYPPQIGKPPPASYGQSSPAVYPTKTAQNPVNPLDSIPFVLAPALTVARTSRFTTDIIPIQKQMQQLKERLESSYVYDFTLEYSVLREHSNNGL